MAELDGHETRFPSLIFWKDGMSFTRTGVRVPAVEKPSDAFRLMFVDDSEELRKFERSSLNSSGSILDAVREDAKSYQSVLGTEDRQKLEEYFTSIRETERKVELAEDWKVVGDKKQTGRPGMDLWQILVLGAVRLARGCDYDQLEHTANFDSLVRQIMGIDVGFGAQECKTFHHKTLSENVCHLDGQGWQTIQWINPLATQHCR